MRRDLPPLPDEPDAPTSGGPSTDADSVAALEALADGYHQLMRDALATFVAASRADIAREVGVSAAVLLELDRRLPPAVVRQLETVASRLVVMPDCADVYAARIIEFTDLAAIVGACARLSGKVLAEVDRWAADRACHLADHELLHLLEPDVLTRVEQLRAPGWANRQERRAEAGQALHAQQDFDGGGRITASLDKVGFTTTLTAIETCAGPPSPDTPRPRQRAEGLVAIAEHALAGSPAGSPPLDIATSDTTEPRTSPRRGQTRIPIRPRARVSVVVDLAQATGDRFALLQRVSGLADAPTLTARLTDALAAEAELLVHVTNGKQPLAELRAEDIPDAVRRVVVARDRGCRAPGCTAPPSHCDIHHIVARKHGGPHRPENLILLCRRHHTLVGRWRAHLEPTDALVTWRYGTNGRPRRTLPHGTRPPPPRPPDVTLPDWLAPPIPPPPDDRDEPPLPDDHAGSHPLDGLLGEPPDP